MRPPVQARPTQRELHEAYNLGVARAREDAARGGDVPSAEAIRAAAAAAYSHPELAATWADGYAVTAAELTAPPPVAS